MEQNKSAAMTGIVELSAFLYNINSEANVRLEQLFLEEINNIFNDFPNVSCFHLEAEVGELLCVYSEQLIEVDYVGDLNLDELEYRVNKLFTSVPLSLLSTLYHVEAQENGEITIEREN